MVTRELSTLPESAATRTAQESLRRSKSGVWWLAIAIMGFLAVGWGLRKELSNLRDTRSPGESLLKIDLWQRHREVRHWFQGRLVYDTSGSGVYPPATYSMLAPVLLPQGRRTSRIGWLVGSVAALVWLARQLQHHSLAEQSCEKMFLLLMPFSFYSTWSALGVGQLVPFVLPLLVISAWLVTRPQTGVRQGWLAALGMVLALVQPTLSAPFFWLFLICSARWKPAFLVVGLYLALTAIACPFQAGLFDPAPGAVPIIKPDGTKQAPPPMPREQALAIRREWGWKSWVGGSLKVIRRWAFRAHFGSFHGATSGGNGTLHDLFARLGLRRLNWTGSLLALALLGAWIGRYRSQDLWLLLGVTAIVARLWTYHRQYDDLLLLLPLIALFRITKQSCYSDIVRSCTAALFVGNWLLLLAPGLHTIFGSNGVFAQFQILLWLATLGWLAWITHLEWRRGRVDTSRFPLPEPTAG